MSLMRGADLHGNLSPSVQTNKYASKSKFLSPCFPVAEQDIQTSRK